MRRDPETIFEAARQWVRDNAPESVPISVEHPEYGIIHSIGSSSNLRRSELNLLAFVDRFRAVPCERFKLCSMANRWCCSARKHRCFGEHKCRLCSDIRSIGYPTLDHLEYFRAESGSPILVSHAYEIDVDRLASICARCGIRYRVFDPDASWYFPYRTHLIVLGEQRYLDFRALAEQEPRLRILEDELLAIRKNKNISSEFCANAIWYGGYRDKVSQLVGWDVRETRPEIGSDAAYDIAYDYLYDLLPNCRHREICW